MPVSWMVIMKVNHSSSDTETPIFNLGGGGEFPFT